MSTSTTIRLHSSLYLDLENPLPEQIRLADIAAALSKLCRFGGHVKKFYSVAEHSIHCANVAIRDGLSAEQCRAVFLHDAAEAYIGDLVRPLKRMFRDWALIEADLEIAIASRLNVDFLSNHKLISEIDNAMLFAEREILFEADGIEWLGQQHVRKLDRPPTIWHWDPVKSEEEFLAMCRFLGLKEADAPDVVDNQDDDSTWIQQG